MIAYSAVPSTITRATITRTISVFCIEEEGPICLLIHQCHARHLYKEARRVINFQAAIASGIKKNGSVPELLLLACGSIWKENDSCNIFSPIIIISSDYSAASTTARFINLGVLLF